MHAADIDESVRAKKMSTKKKAVFAILALSIASLMTALSIEFAFRVYKYLRPGRFYVTHTSDPELGWHPRPGKHDALRNVSNAGTDETWAEGVEPSYFIDQKGFRRWDDENRTGPVVLIIGDSFTEAEYAGSGGTYFDRIAQELPCRMYVFGCSGYGTLQETLVLERFVKTIRPDIVVLQMCDNDLFNNEPELIQSNLNWDPGQAVPFLQDDGSVRMQEIRYEGLGKALIGRSMAVPYLMRRFGLIPWASSFEYDGSPAFQRAVDRTGRILKRFRESCGKDTTVLAFAECTGKNPEREEPVFRRLCEEAGITYMDNVSGALRNEEIKAGDAKLGRCDGPRGHYNLFGHHVIGKALVPHLRQAAESRKASEAAKPAGN